MKKSREIKKLSRILIGDRNEHIENVYPNIKLNKGSIVMNKETEQKINEFRKKRRHEILGEEVTRRHSERRAFINEAKAHSVTEDQLEFLEKYFERKGHKHWDGRVG